LISPSREFLELELQHGEYFELARLGTSGILANFGPPWRTRRGMETTIVFRRLENSSFSVPLVSSDYSLPIDGFRGVKRVGPPTA
jgi:hypothetical protein